MTLDTFGIKYTYLACIHQLNESEKHVSICSFVLSDFSWLLFDSGDIFTAAPSMTIPGKGPHNFRPRLDPIHNVYNWEMGYD